MIHFQGVRSVDESQAHLLNANTPRRKGRKAPTWRQAIWRKSSATAAEKFDLEEVDRRADVEVLDNKFVG